MQDTERAGRQRAIFVAVLAAFAALAALALSLSQRGAPPRAALGPREPARSAEPEPRRAQARGAAELRDAEAAQEQERAARVDATRTPAERAARSQGSGRIAGRVLYPDGRTPAAGVRVLVTPGAIEPAPRRVLELLHTPASGQAATTDADGSFAIEGLDPAPPYALIAGKEGWVGQQRVWVVRADRELRDYGLHRLFGAVVRLSEQGGDPIRLHPGLQGQRMGRSVLRVPGVFPLHGRPAAAVLAGIDVELLEHVGLDARLQLFTSAEAHQTIAPIRYQARFPGYEPLELELAARHTAQGLPEYTAALRPTAAGFGSLAVDLHGWSGPCLPFEGRSGPAAVLTLRATRGETLAFDLREIGREGFQVHGLPYGEWVAALTHVAGGAPGGDLGGEVAIGPVPARLTIDLSRQASLELDLVDARGERHTGNVSLLLGRESGVARAWRTQHLLGPPYRIDGLEPGAYRVVLQVPYSAGTSAERPLIVLARGGHCARVELREE